MRAKKAVVTISMEDVVTQPADAPTCVERVGVPNPITGAPTVIKARPVLNYEALETGLSRHPDRAFVTRLSDYTRHGVPSGTMVHVHHVNVRTGLLLNLSAVKYLALSITMSNSAEKQGLFNAPIQYFCRFADGRIFQALWENAFNP